MRRMLTLLDCDPEVPLADKKQRVVFVQRYIRAYQPQASDMLVLL
jgi:hypothetical protein